MLEKVLQKQIKFQSPVQHMVNILHFFLGQVVSICNNMHALCLKQILIFFTSLNKTTGFKLWNIWKIFLHTISYILLNFLTKCDWQSVLIHTCVTRPWNTYTGLGWTQLIAHNPIVEFWHVCSVKHQKREHFSILCILCSHYENAETVSVVLPALTCLTL